MVSMLSLLTLAATVAALKVTSPDDSTVWETGTSQTIEWEAVSSDQETFNIYLSNMASYPPTSILLLSDVSSSDSSATIDGSQLPEGNAFRINFTNGTETEQIYAQSDQFNITEGSSTPAPSSPPAGATPTTSASPGTASSFTTDTTTSTGSGTATTTVSSPTKSANSGATGSATNSASEATSTADATADATADSTTATGSGATATSTTPATAGAGKAVAGVVGAVVLAVLAL